METGGAVEKSKDGFPTHSRNPLHHLLIGLSFLACSLVFSNSIQQHQCENQHYSKTITVTDAPYAISPRPLLRLLQHPYNLVHRQLLPPYGEISFASGTRFSRKLSFCVSEIGRRL